jgi:hypothetical protein
MKLVILGCLFFFAHAQVERIWFIRHCDKPKSPENPCCSDTGYKRAAAWADYFRTHFTDAQIYTSNYNEKKTCIVSAAKPDRSCQKSQRMYLTASLIHTPLVSTLPLNTDFCVGDEQRIVEHIRNHRDAKEVLVVWEHKEIVHLIREFGIPLSKWRNRFENEYTLVFMVDVKTKQLYYDCFDFLEREKGCSPGIRDWLKTEARPMEYVYKTEKPSNTPIFMWVMVVVGAIAYSCRTKMRRGYTMIV